MDVTELRPGLWRWTAPHPAWIEGADWPREVGCVYYEAPGAVVLIDPLVPPEQEGFFRALDRDLERADRPLAILLTVLWHEQAPRRSRNARHSVRRPPTRGHPAFVPGGR